MDVFMKVRAVERIRRKHSKLDTWICDTYLPVIKQWEKMGGSDRWPSYGGSMTGCYPC